ncbi:serpentine type 7TM GPCR receptor class ab chemoreceptor domain-containing protein [Ditylenchus destructor]|uniref:Serpentine type 7TM GPCR receptor class ab chemoreceptor domain-containing protein n=1 Tax=Ditylenchus destructor TaxID=166010 RepID=A0AAD4R4U3_9BILA|nr:serpentine type 7TM GPCR receptor class ab chemoreceptor domain-containing protein [Ditylenchus destructor]
MITWQCHILRLPVFCAIIGFSLLHLFLFLERCLATVYLRTYANSGRKLGIAATFIIWSIAIAWNAYIVHDDDLLEYKAYCLQTTPNNGSRMLQMLSALLFIDLCTTFGDIILRIVNNRQKKRKNVDYSLRKSYQISENETTTRVILTLSLVHSLTFTSYLLATVIARASFGGAGTALYTTIIEYVHLMITLYLVSTLCIAFYLKRSIRRHKVVQVTSARDQTDVYFAQLNQQLSRNIPANTKR